MEKSSIVDWWSFVQVDFTLESVVDDDLLHWHFNLSGMKDFAADFVGHSQNIGCSFFLLQQCTAKRTCCQYSFSDVEA